MRGAVLFSVAAVACAASPAVGATSSRDDAGCVGAKATADPQAAALACERVLMRDPDDDAARLALVDLLLRLDDGIGAAREIARLEPLMLPPEQVDALDALRLRLAHATGAPR